MERAEPRYGDGGSLGQGQRRCRFFLFEIADDFGLGWPPEGGLGFI